MKQLFSFFFVGVVSCGAFPVKAADECEQIRQELSATKNDALKQIMLYKKLTKCQKTARAGGPNANHAAPVNQFTPGTASSPTAGRSSAQLIADCDNDIKSKQLESQRWSGSSIEIANRLGRYQKDLFEGRCAGHPEAQAYLAGANKMLSYREGTTGGGRGTLPPLASSGNRAEQASPDRSRTRKVHNPAADARNCVRIVDDGTRRGAGTSGHRRFVNNCGVAVEIFWCTVAECQRGSGNTWTVGAGRGWPIMTKEDVRWGACKGRDGGGFDRGTVGTRYTCHLLTW